MASDTKKKIDRKRKLDEDAVLYNAPSDIDVMDFVGARIAEMTAMAKASNYIEGNSRAMQKLPRHMRRRAASHNVKRLPRRLRAIGEWEMSNAPPSKTKRPSRKHRRRPSNLLQDYARRQRKNVWLESHIWHAKRFHMTEKWGYKLAHFSNEKGHRACYRAAVSNCIMWDTSYLCCIEVEGPEILVINSLKQIMSEETGPTIGAKYYLDGTREGSTFLYKHENYPFNVLGPCKFMWKSVLDDKESKSEKRSIWLWMHPAIYNEVLHELSIVTNTTLQVDNPVDEKQVLDSQIEKELPENSTSNMKHSMVNPVYVSENITVKSLKDSLCRFKLAGPNSQCILRHMLNCSPKTMKDDKLNTEECKGDCIDMNEKYEMWWKKYFEKDAMQNVCIAQNDAWNIISKQASPASVRSQSILGLTVRDPRLELPLARNKALPETMSNEIPHYDPSRWQPAWSHSPLWDEEVRENVKSTKISEQEMNKLRSKLLVPGSNLKLGVESKVPIMLIHNPGVQSSESAEPARVGQGSGWDIILPSGWSMAFWIGLVYRGARVGGLREMHQFETECQALHFPHDFPDANAGQIYEESDRIERKNKHDRMPPAKRPNYEKLGVLSPFGCPWSILLDHWSTKAKRTDDKRFFVLRNRKCLKHLDSAIKQKNDLNVKLLSDNIDRSLVAIKIKLTAKGSPDRLSELYLPFHEDLELLRTNPKYGGPVEVIHEVDNTQILDKSKILKASVTALSEQSSSDDLITETGKTAGRQRIGYLTEGGFHYTSGHGFGLGFASLHGLVKLLDDQKEEALQYTVLVRSISSVQYRFAKLHIIL